MLEKFENIIFGKTIGVISFVSPIVGGDIHKQMTSFKVHNGAFSLVSNTSNFKKSDVEKHDTIITVLINNNHVNKEFLIEDSIDKSLFEKTLVKSYNMSWINFSDKIVASEIDENHFTELYKEKNIYIKDHHFLIIGALGLDNIEQLGIVNLDKGANLLVEKEKSQYLLDESSYDLMGLNALGIVGAIFTQKALNTKDNFRNDKNVLKSFTKRILFKMVPIILVILILNYVYANKLTTDITASDYELSLINNLLGEKQLTQELKSEDLKYFDQLSSSFNIQRTHLINELIECHEKGITYKKIVVDPVNIKNNDNDVVINGTGEIWFETKNTDLINSWEQRIRKLNRFSNVELIELNTDNKGISKGYISFIYE